MRAVLQRVSSASVVVNGGNPRTIGPGLMILLGVKDGDDPAIIPKLAAKCAGLRIFADDEGKLNRSAVELGYSVLVVSKKVLVYSGQTPWIWINFMVVLLYFHSSV